MAPIVARATPGWPSVMEMSELRIEVEMKKTAKTVTALTTRISAANTMTLAASISSRLGTASSEDRIAPVVYSLENTMTPRTLAAGSPTKKPGPKISPVGADSAYASAGCGPGWPQLWCRTTAKSVLKPMATTTNAARDHTVERTERILVHSAASSPVHGTLAARPPGRAGLGASWRVVLITHSVRCSRVARR